MNQGQLAFKEIESGHESFWLGALSGILLSLLCLGFAFSLHRSAGRPENVSYPENVDAASVPGYGERGLRRVNDRDWRPNWPWKK